MGNVNFSIANKEINVKNERSNETASLKAELREKEKIIKKNEEAIERLQRDLRDCRYGKTSEK